MGQALGGPPGPSTWSLRCCADTQINETLVLEEVVEELFPMVCMKMDTFLMMKSMLSYQELHSQGLLVSPEGSIIHFVSHEWLSRDHPDPSSIRLKRIQAIFLQIIRGQGRALFSDADWNTFINGTSLQQSSPASAGLDKVAEASLITAVQEGVVWLDFGCIPQLQNINSVSLNEHAQTQEDAKHSIPFYLDRSHFFWVLATSVVHEESGESRGYTSWRGNGWCRFEEWANFLSMTSRVPLVVTEAQKISTFSFLSFVLDNLNKPERAPCNGEFWCCNCNHQIVMECGKCHIPCERRLLVSVLNRIYNNKVREQLQVAPAMAHFLCGVEHTLYAGAASFAHVVHPSVAAGDESDKPEAFARRVGFKSAAADGPLGQDLLQVAVWCHHNSMVRQLLSRRDREGGEAFHRDHLGMNAFDAACVAGNVEAVDLFFGTGGIGEELLSVPVLRGGTILQAAAQNGHRQVVELLLERRADVDFRKLPDSNFAGRTALHCASLTCQVHCCKVLLQHGASVNAKDAKGMTPFALADVESPLVVGCQDSSARSDTLKLLLAAMADSEVRDLE